MLLGQEKLYDTFNEMSFNELPHTFMLSGELGCGKHTFSKYIAEKFGLVYSDITDIVSADLLDDLQIKNILTLYVIDITKFNDKQQYKLLKFLEDIHDFIYICVLNSNAVGVLPTIKNRCIQYKFDNLSSDIKREFASKYFRLKDLDIVDNVCDTIGQIINAQGQDFIALQELCINIINKIGSANLSNALSLASRFNYKEDFDKFDVVIFFNMMLIILCDLFIKDKIKLNVYTLTLEYRKKLNDGRLKKQDIVERYLVNLWKLMREMV